jgi:hypothetical protein
MQWLRLYHDTITDEKWRVVANESGQPVGNVLAVWMSMLINASNSSERGTLEGWQDRYVAANLGYPTDAVRAIREAMQGVVLDGDRLSGWDNRQRASDDAGGRQRKTRERRETKPPGGGGHGGNGHDPEHSATTTECRATLPDCLATVAENPLRAQTPDSEKKEGGGGGAGAPEVASRVAELTRLPATDRNIATVKDWLAAGYDPDQDIYPAVAGALPTATSAIGHFAYFTGPIGRRHAARISPPSNVSYLPRAAGGRQVDPPMSKAGRDLMAALSNPNFDYGMRR